MCYVFMCCFMFLGLKFYVLLFCCSKFYVLCFYVLCVVVCVMCYVFMFYVFICIFYVLCFTQHTHLIDSWRQTIEDQLLFYLYYV